MKMLNKNIKISLILATLSFIFPGFIFAAQVSIKSDKNDISTGGDVLVSVYIDTESDSVNAIDGKLVFQAGDFEVKEIRDGNSFVNFWVERPHLSNEGEISFSGITPGGLMSKDRLVFSVLLKTKRSTDSTFTIKDLQVLKNDGVGTKIKASISPLKISVSSSATSQSNFDFVDNVMPDDFKPTIGSDPDIFNGSYFLVFTAQDKGSGIDHYEVREGFWGDFTNATSPYLLKDQSLKTKIYVKAVDKKGNDRIVIVSPQKSSPLYQQLIILGIIIFVCILIFKRKKRNQFL